MSDGFVYEFSWSSLRNGISSGRELRIYRPLNLRTRVLAFFGIYVGPQ